MVMAKKKSSMPSKAMRMQEELFQQMQGLNEANDEAEFDMPVHLAPSRAAKVMRNVQSAGSGSGSAAMNVVPFGQAQSQDANGSVAVARSRQAALESILDETQLALADGKTDKGLATVPISAIMSLMDAGEQE